MKRVSHPALLSVICAAFLLVSGCGGTSQQSAAPDSSPHIEAEAAAGSSPSPSLTVAAAGNGESVRISRKTGKGGTTRAITDGGIRVSSYDSTTGRAVLTRSAGATRGTTPGGGGGRTPGIRAGDVIASPATPELPKGALVKVTAVGSTAGPRTEVSTTPANLTDLFGNARANGKVPVDPAAWTVKALVKGVDVTRRAGAGRQGASRGGGTDIDLKPGTLRMALHTPLPVPPIPGKGASVKADLGGFVELTPEVSFSYHRAGGADIFPASASIELTGAYQAGWQLKGEMSATRSPIHVPFAKATANPVIMVGPVPVVVNLGVTFFYDVSANGKVSFQVDQDVKGDVTVGAQYTRHDGWKPDVHAGGKPSPLRATLIGAGYVRAAIGSEASIGLYDTVGLSATLAPYVRAAVAGTVSAQTGGPPVKVDGTWGLYAGLTLDGALYARLAIFGTPIVEHRIPVPILSREWTIGEGKPHRG